MRQFPAGGFAGLLLSSFFEQEKMNADVEIMNIAIHSFLIAVSYHFNLWLQIAIKTG